MTITLTREEAQSVLDALVHSHATEPIWKTPLKTAIETLCARLSAPEPAKLWLWKNFVDGRPEYWAFDNPYPRNLNDGDPQTIGQPCGYAIFKFSRDGSNGRTEEQVLHEMASVNSKSQPEPEPVAKMKELLEVQGRDGNWNLDPYMQGMYNGMELMVALAERRDPVFRKAPENWLSAPPQRECASEVHDRREWQGMTDEEIKKEQHHIDWTSAHTYAKFARAIEAKLKEKNT
jgi:hypothetical protein